MIGRSEIVAIINTVWDAVGASKVGPIVIDDPDTGEPQLQTVSYNTFLAILNKVVPMETTLSGEMNCSETSIKVSSQ